MNLDSFCLQDAGSKKASLDSMSKEELVGRCKNLLQLAQRAKSAKDGRLRLAAVSGVPRVS